MNTIGWFFILTAIWLVRAVGRGQVVDGTGKFVLFDNMEKTVTALIRGDGKALAEADKPSGPGLLSPTPEPETIPESSFDPATPPSSGSGNGGGGGGSWFLDKNFKPSGKGTSKVTGNAGATAQAAANIIGPQFGVQTIGTYPGHLPDEQHALDFMITSVAQGDAIANFAQKNATKLNLQYIIWNMKIWSVARQSEGWRVYKPISSSGDFRHEHHVHISFN